MPKPIREYLFYVSGSWTISVKSNDLRQAIKKAKTQISNPNHPTAIWLFQHDKHNNHSLIGTYQTASSQAFVFSPVLKHFKL